MAQHMAVDTTELRNSANTIKDKTAKYRSEYQNLYSEIEELRVVWQGQASDKFNKQIEGYRNDFEELAKILESYAEFLTTTAQNIENTENALNDAASQLNAGV